MIFYIAAPFGDHSRANSLADLLRSAGHAVTSRWHIEARELAEQGRDLRDPTNPSVAAETHERNLRDLDDADVVVVLLDGAHVPYTTLIEYGYAQATACRCYVVAPQPWRLGLHHADTSRFESLHALVAALCPATTDR